MASDRDTLAELIAQNLDAHYSIDADNAGPIEAGIEAGCAAALAKGWRPPAHTITTAEERDALPAGCMVKQLTTGIIFRRTTDITTLPAKDGRCAQIRYTPGDWYDANGNCCFDLDLAHYPTIDLPLEVVWLPTAEATGE